MNINKQKFAKQLGSNIAKYRQTTGLTQEQLAEKLDLGNETISRIERGVAMPSLMRLFEFANVFHCNVADLLAGNSSLNKDDVEYLATLLQNTSKADKDFVIGVVEKLVDHLKTRS